MNQPSAIETRIGALIAAYADRAPVEVDPMTITRFAVSSRTSRWRLVGIHSPTRGLGFLLLALTALITLVAGAIVAGQSLRRDPEDILVERGFAEPFIGLPPEGVAPSIPETGELVFSFGGRVRSIGLDFHRMWVYADGRLIWKSNLEGSNDGWRQAFGASTPTTAVIEQRLTPAGVDLMRSEVLAAAQLADPRRFGDDDLDWNLPGVLWGGMMVNVGGQLLATTWSDPTLPGRLANPASWLPATAWADSRIGGFVPTRHAVCRLSDDPALGIDGLPEPVRTLLVANGTQIAMPGEPTPDCLEVTTDVAREIVAALDASGVERGPQGVGLEYRFRNPAPHSSDRVEILPIVPHGEIVCACG